jgi:Xaa-Pro dipeptidase
MRTDTLDQPSRRLVPAALRLHRALSHIPGLLLVAAVICSGLPARAGAQSASSAPAGKALWQRRADGSTVMFDGRVVPALPKLLDMREQFNVRREWVKKRHALMLPLLRKHGVGMWIVVNEEFHPDPLTEHVAPALQYTGRRDVHVFVDAGDAGLKAFGSYRRPSFAYAGLFESLPGDDPGAALRTLYDKYQPRTIALNYGGTRGQDSGLTHDSYQFLAGALGADATARFMSAGKLIEDYLDTRLPEELEHYRQLVLATDVIAQRALSNEVITPGITTAEDVMWWFNQQIASLGVGAKPWFQIHTAVQRFDAATGKAIAYVHPAPNDYVFQRGDVIHLDCGFDYMGLASDWQKVAYILREGETDASPGMKKALHNGWLTLEALRTSARPGMTGNEVAAATLEKLKGLDFTPSLYSHPIGTHGHGVGAQVNARNGVIGVGPERDFGSRLRLGSYRSIELSATTRVPEWNGAELTIPFEDDAYLTENGYEWFRPPQTAWYLIR